MADTPRQAWMTAELEAELQKLAHDGCLTCEQVQAFAAKHALEITKMKPFVDSMGLRISNCRGLCAQIEPFMSNPQR